LTVENERGEKQHYLRAMGPINPESLSTYPARLNINRNSAYSPPKWAEGLTSGVLQGYDTRQCSVGISATIDPETAKNPGFQEHVRATQTKSVAQEAEVLFTAIKKYAFAEQSGTSTATAPPCVQQPPFTPIYGSGSPTTYQQTFEQPAP
jgi:hypothetical protein